MAIWALFSMAGALFACEAPRAAKDTSSVDSAAVDSAAVDSAAVESIDVDIIQRDTPIVDVENADAVSVGDTTDIGDATIVGDIVTDGADAVTATDSIDDTDGLDALLSQPTPPTAGGTLALTLGSASPDGLQWQPWPPNSAEATAIFGPQGGHHVWVSLCVPASFGTSAKVKITLKLENSGLIVFPGPTSLVTALKPLPGHPGQLCRLGIPAFITCACTIRARLLRVRAEIQQQSIVVGWREISVRLQVPGTSPCPKKNTTACLMQLP